MRILDRVSPDASKRLTSTPYFATVRNGTALLPSRDQDRGMLHKKNRKKAGNLHLAGVNREMAKPRMARSARIAELKLHTTRDPDPASATVPGVVDKIIPSPRRSQPEKAQITVDGPDHQHQDLRIENALTDEHGDDVKLKKGNHVEVTVAAEPSTSSASKNSKNKDT